ncbi:DUF3325 family protein [Cognatilysobacter bugurensis]|uniref:DUF3325 domain-containing protein n=1 Tax=Cognatilysobacter bugurensis TaxID=543356 RepID=A0A918SZA2_9GAMM|nr:DUF3325 family protein [Lysobacter bugurensis]GHA80298.1 hypothetical protein GCM10007067_17530 [Lysobacter bugurensis]
MAWCAALLIVVGWGALMASMERHADLFTAVPASMRAGLRIAAWALFAISFALFVGTLGIEQGPVYWTVCLMLGAIAVVLSATFGSSRTVRGR